MDRQRSELSKRNPYWLEKHRFMELRHFCMQYPSWKKAYLSFYGYPKQSISEIKIGMGYSNPTENIAIERQYYRDRMDMVENTCKEAADDLWQYLLKGVTQGIGYNVLNPPCCKDVYYDMYRKFFYLLSNTRE